MILNDSRFFKIMCFAAEKMNRGQSSPSTVALAEFRIREVSPMALVFPVNRDNIYSNLYVDNGGVSMWKASQSVVT